MNENSIMVIHPYLHKGTWVFDDEEKSLHREPFIAGIDTMISMVVESEKLDSDGFSVCFSASFMPGATLPWTGFVRKEEEIGINVPSLEWKAGCVPPFTSTFQTRRKRFTPSFKRGSKARKLIL